MALMLFIAFQGFSQIASTSGKVKDSKNTTTTTSTIPGKFVDKNKDGICDNHQAKMNGAKCANFIDKNADGICDNNPNCGKGKGNCNGYRMGCQQKQGQGKGNCCGNGCGNQHRHGYGNQSTPAAEPQKPNDKK